MRRLLGKFNRSAFVIATTLFSILSTWLLMIFIYQVMEEEIRLSEIMVGTLAPLLLAPTITWYLFGLLFKLDLLEKEMRELATYDQLTGVMTRRAFMEKAALYFSIAARSGNRFGILLVDLDHFKQINDTFGHIAGDSVLKQFGAIITAQKRESDLAGRYGGEEFIILLPDTELPGVLHYAYNLQSRLKNTEIESDDEKISCTASVGVAMFQPCEIENLQQIIQRADKALYHAKTAGRNKTVVFNDISN